MAAAHRLASDTSASAATGAPRVHPEGQWQATTDRDRDDRGPGSPTGGQDRAGTRLGSSFRSGQLRFAIDEGVAVVAEAFADAQCGLLALNVEWNDEHAERRSSEDLLHEHQRLVASGERAVVARADGNVEDGFARATHTIDAFYELPYLAHAPMEPNDAVCRMGE